MENNRDILMAIAKLNVDGFIRTMGYKEAKALVDNMYKECLENGTENNYLLCSFMIDELKKSPFCCDKED